MGRPPRLIDPTGRYHVTTRGNYRQAMFPDPDCFEQYLTFLTRVAKKRRWLVADWCLMPNHVHLVLQLEDGGLSDGMRDLNGRFSSWSNALHKRTGTGHLVKNRFWASLVDTEHHVLQLARYLPLNPVAASLVIDPLDWPWSGYRAAAGAEPPRLFHRPELVLELFDRDPSRAQRMLSAFVGQGMS